MRVLRSAIADVKLPKNNYKSCITRTLFYGIAYPKVVDNPINFGNILLALSPFASTLELSELGASDPFFP
jgi:hypothetical protein